MEDKCSFTSNQLGDVAMASTTINRLKKSFTAVPQSVIHAAHYLLSIGQEQKKINLAKKKAKEAIDKIKSDLEVELTPLVKERDTFFTALYTFAQGKKGELTAKLRSVKTEQGTFGWRFTPPYVELDEGEDDASVVAYLRAHNMTKYVRVKYELDREALLSDRPDVPGVSYLSREEFFAKPKLISKVDGSAEELSIALPDEGKTEAIDV